MHDSVKIRRLKGQKIDQIQLWKEGKYRNE